MFLFPGGATVAALYAADAVVFDGSTDAGAMTVNPSLSANKFISISGWIKMGTGTDGSGFFIIEGFDTNMRVWRDTANKLQLVYDGGSAGAAFIKSATSIVVASGWTHFAISLNTTTSAVHNLYINGADDSPTTSITNDREIEWGTPTSGEIITIGRRISPGGGGGSFWDGDMFDIWMDDSYVDFSVAGTLAKFISGGKPVDLGATGELPTGTKPLLFAHIDEGETAVNFFDMPGSAPFADFTAFGSIATASSSPTD
jgi:hypothetical protein